MHKWKKLVAGVLSASMIMPRISDGYAVDSDGGASDSSGGEPDRGNHF